MSEEPGKQKPEAYVTFEFPRYDGWEESYEGKCDICHATTALSDVTPGVQYGWRVGYVCSACVERNKRKGKFNE